jgi:hypothetical protein
VSTLSHICTLDYLAADGKKKSNYAALPLLFAPRIALKSNIRLATQRIANQFDSIGAAVNRGVPLSQATTVDQFEATLRNLLSSSRLAGFTAGAKYSEVAMPTNYGKIVHSMASKRARNASGLMARTTRKLYKSLSDIRDARERFVLSGERASRAASYEAATAYNRGLLDAFQNEPLWGKMWVTSSNEPCEDCQDNEDQGTIGFDEAFDSGDDAPPIHLNCQCYLGVERLG